MPADGSIIGGTRWAGAALVGSEASRTGNGLADCRRPGEPPPSRGLLFAH
jgi:hypothetical protein